MKSFVISTILCSWVLIQPQCAQRRTAPRRTTSAGGTYGTETYATVTEASTQSTQPRTKAAAIPAPFYAPLSAVPASSATRPGSPFAVPVAQGVAAMLPGVVVSMTPRPTKSGQTPRVIATMPPREEDGQDTPGESLAGQKHIPVVSLCEEVEEILKPGSTEQECFVAEPVTLRYWQPYRALRSIKCKNGNTTETGAGNDRCPATYPGAKCVQKYQQFVVLASMGPASSGWSCIRLGSGCSCSVRNFKRLRTTDYEQRTDLREFMKTA